MCIRTSNKISKLYIKVLKIKHKVYKYTYKYYTITNIMKLLFKIYVKLTLQCRSNCSDVKDDLKLARDCICMCSVYMQCEIKLF